MEGFGKTFFGNKMILILLEISTNRLIINKLHKQIALNVTFFLGMKVEG